MGQFHGNSLGIGAVIDHKWNVNSNLSQGPDPRLSRRHDHRLRGDMVGHPPHSVVPIRRALTSHPRADPDIPPQVRRSRHAPVHLVFGRGRDHLWAYGHVAAHRPAAVHLHDATGSGLGLCCAFDTGDMYHHGVRAGDEEDVQRTVGHVDPSTTLWYDRQRLMLAKSAALMVAY